MSTDINYDDALRARIEANLLAHDLREHPLDGRRHAAIGVVVMDSHAELHGHDPTKIDRAKELAGLPGIDDGYPFTGRVDYRS